MATAVVMPKLGQSVETCILVSWKKAKGDSVIQGDPICEVETDMATLEVESPCSGTVLDLYFQEGQEVLVLVNIAAIGEPDEDTSDLEPNISGAVAADEQSRVAANEAVQVGSANPLGQEPTPVAPVPLADAKRRISPRAANLADKVGIDVTGIRGTGPGGRIIERDVEEQMTSTAPSAAHVGTTSIQADSTTSIQPESPAGVVQSMPLKGVRKIIADRMLDSLQTTAQLTLNASADARALLAFRERLKNSPEGFGLQHITINDIILFVVSRTLVDFLDLNALYAEGVLSQFERVDLAFAVDSPRGLIVPVIRNTNKLNLKALSQETKRLANACVEGIVTPDELTNATFTVTNLGNLGIESFTPILNPPQVGILGVGNVNLKPVTVDGDVQFVPHIGLSLTINHQVVDGAPAARFLQALSRQLCGIDLLLTAEI